MIAAAANPGIPEPQARTSARREPGAAPGSSVATFDGLLSAVQAGLGVRVSVLAGTLHHDTNLPAGPRADAHQVRLGKMADQATARETGGRRSRLDPGRAADGVSGGPRGQRLALLAEERGRSVPVEAADTAPTGKSRPAPGDKQMSQTAHSDTGRVRADGPIKTDDSAARTGVQSKPAKPLAVASRAIESDTNMSSSRTSEPSLPQSVPAAGPSGIGQARSPSRPAPVARQIAQILSARAGGVQSARAVAGSEQPGAGRGAMNVAAGSTETGSRASRAGTEKPPFGSPSRTSSGQPAQRSAFDQLVRSLRMNVGRQRSTARLHLRPPELGRIRIEARMEGRQLEILVQTETKAADQLLRSRAADLQAALEQQGVKVQRIEFAPPAQQDTAGPFADAGQAQPNPPGSGGGDKQPPDRDQPQQHTEGAEPAIPMQEEGIEPLTSAAAETRLDVRV